MTDRILTSEIEGRRTKDLNEEITIKVGDNEDDLEYLTQWLELNVPPVGSYFKIEIITFEGV